MEDDVGYIPPPLTTRRLDACLEYLLYALLLVMPAARGTVNEFGELFAIIIGGMMAVLLAVRRVIMLERTAGGWLVWAPISLFVLLGAAQLIPLPAAAMQTISPGTYAFKAELLSDLPAALARMPITFASLGTKHDLRIILLTITVFATVLTIFRNPRPMRRLLAVITMIGAAFALLALAQYATRTNKVYWLVDIGERARAGTFVNHSHYGQYMNLSIGAAIALLLSKPSRPVAAALSLFIALGLGTVFLAWTRGGLISAAVALTLSAGVFALVRGNRVLAGVCLLCLAAAPFLGWMIRDAERIKIARDVWTMTWRFGATGVGLGAFEWAYTPFDTTRMFNITAYADNEYVQMLAEVGFGGLAIVLGFAGVIWWHWLRAVRGGDRVIAGIAIGAGYALLAVMIHSLSDFGQHLAANACLSAIFCGLLVNLANAHRKDRPSVPRWSRVVAAVVVIALAAWTMVGADGAARADATYDQAESLARRLEHVDWEGSQNEMDHLRTLLDEAVDLQPDNVKYRYRRALYDWRIAANKYDRDTPERAAAARDVVDQLNAARVVCPTYGLAYSVLGQIELSTLKQEIGYKHLEIATRLEPNDPIVWFAAGRADARRGDVKAANAKFRHARTLDYSIMFQAIALYLDELHMPDAAIELASDSWYYSRMLGAEMNKRPAYTDLATKVFRRAGELALEEARRTRTPAMLAEAALYLLDTGKYAESEAFLAEALRHDPQPAWRLQHAHALIKLNRLDEAEAELRAVERQEPSAAGLAAIRKMLESARAGPTPAK
jgi:tetratricopeptide (TPR) repeat protein